MQIADITQLAYSLRKWRRGTVPFAKRPEIHHTFWIELAYWFTLLYCGLALASADEESNYRLASACNRIETVSLELHLVAYRMCLAELFSDDCFMRRRSLRH